MSDVTIEMNVMGYNDKEIVLDGGGYPFYLSVSEEQKQKIIKEFDLKKVNVIPYTKTQSGELENE